jgi:NADH-quinone oxidoreductase subunit M
MIVLFLFLIPLAGGLISFFLKDDKAVRSWSLLISVLVLALSITANALPKPAESLSLSANWMGSLGSSFSL